MTRFDDQVGHKKGSGSSPTRSLTRVLRHSFSIKFVLIGVLFLLAQTPLWMIEDLIAE